MDFGMTETSPRDLQRRLDERQRQEFAEEGYLVFRSVIDRGNLEVLVNELLAEFHRVQRSGALFTGGGTLSGHLNCFPGEGSRFIYEALERQGIIDIVHALSPAALRLPNVGCNFNLPGSSAQNEHVDGYAAKPFFVANVAAVDTDLRNGAMEILRGTHRSVRKYWEIVRDRPERRRVCVQAGDVVIRVSSLWHRGMPNLTSRARPMLAFTWEEGGSTDADPYRVHDGKITFLPNRYADGWKGRLQEHAVRTVPRLSNAFRAVRSLLE
jgi:ectoine hydroxylase-related dioxygenase (phytanoyl-CoA dioxygenase family)